MNAPVAEQHAPNYEHIRELEIELGFREPTPEERTRLAEQRARADASTNAGLLQVDAEIARIEELLAILREKRALIVADSEGAA